MTRKTHKNVRDNEAFLWETVDRCANNWKNGNLEDVVGVLSNLNPFASAWVAMQIAKWIGVSRDMFARRLLSEAISSMS